jgi:nitrogen fixation/metabolism regulation signal transduction histidine kinase
MAYPYPQIERMYSMIKSLFREIKEDEDVTDFIAKFFAFIAIPAALFVIFFAIWTIFVTPGNACGPGIC